MAPKVSPEVFPPGEYIREELEARGWTQTDLAKILGWWPKDVSRLVTGKQPITLETAKCLAEAFGTSAQLWMNLESSYQLSKRNTGADPGVVKRAKIYSKVPVSEMQKRGWIESTENADILEAQVLEFYEIPSLDHPIVLDYAARMPEHGRDLNQFQVAWLKRARQIAPAAPAVGQFSTNNLDVALKALTPLKASAEDIRRVPEMLSRSGIRLVVVEALPHTKIDGACFWLSPEAPVIVLSFRYDRIDWFWHTLAHELKHVANGDGKESAVIDMQLVGEDAKPYVEDKPQAERDADLFAISYLIDQKELDNFIARVHPLYSHMKILSFADRIGVHPGIVVGQLHFRKKISYAHSRKMLVKARGMLSASALTDGWGHVVPVGIGGM